MGTEGVQEKRNNMKDKVNIQSIEYDKCTDLVAQIIINYYTKKNQGGKKGMRKKAYVYTRVSTAIQVDGFSLEGQFKEIEAYCKYKHIDIAGKYEDAGISGTSIQGRVAFQTMMEDVRTKKEVDYVIVWKLSRFGRNACDILQSL